MAWKMMAFPVDGLCEVYAEKQGVEEVVEILVFDDSAHTHCCSLSPNYEAWPVAVCFRLNRPHDDVEGGEQDELDLLGHDWIGDSEHNPYIPTNLSGPKCDVPEGLAEDLPTPEQQDEDDCNLRQIIGEVFADFGTMTTETAKALGVNGKKDYLVCV